MWKYAKSQYLEKMLRIIEQVTRKKIVVNFRQTVRGPKINVLQPSWSAFTQGVRRILKAKDEEKQFYSNFISYWQKFMIALLFIGLPTPRISDIDSVCNLSILLVITNLQYI